MMNMQKNLETKKNKIKEYWESPALSQSFLKKVLVNDTKEDKKDSIFMSRGSYVDDLLAFGEEYIAEMYEIMKGNYPAPMWKSTIESLNKDVTLDDKEILLEVFRQNNKSKLLDENVLAGYEENWYYKEALDRANGKKLLTYEESLTGDFIVYKFKNHQFVKHIFELDGEYQVPLYWNYTCGNLFDEKDIASQNVECKGLIDRLIIDDISKTVQIVDFKVTSEELYKWPRGLCRKFNVPFQLSYYHKGLQENIDALGLQGYKLLFPMVLIENMDNPGKPRIYQMTIQDLIQGTHGYERVSSDVVTDGEIHQPEIYKKYGWMDAIYRYCKAKQLNLPDYDIEYWENKGVFDLNSFT